MHSLPLPGNLEELENQLEELRTYSEKFDHLDLVDHELGVKLKGGIKGNPFEDVGISDEKSKALITAWRNIIRAIPDLIKRLSEEQEGIPRGNELINGKKVEGSHILWYGTRINSGITKGWLKKLGIWKIG